MLELRFEKFKRENYEEYNSWFSNEQIKKALFDIEGNWLEYVLNDTTGAEYAVFTGNELSAVVGIIHPTSDYPTYGIKNIAVHPDKFRQGIGSRVLELLLKMHSLNKDEYWIAFVDEENHSAQRFFEHNDWIQKDAGEAGKNMIRYEKRIH